MLKNIIINKYEGSIKSSIKPLNLNHKKIIIFKEGYIIKAKAGVIIIKKDIQASNIIISK